MLIFWTYKSNNQEHAIEPATIWVNNVHTKLEKICFCDHFTKVFAAFGIMNMSFLILFLCRVLQGIFLILLVV